MAHKKCVSVERPGLYSRYLSKKGKGLEARGIEKHHQMCIATIWMKHWVSIAVKQQFLDIWCTIIGY